MAIRQGGIAHLKFRAVGKTVQRSFCRKVFVQKRKIWVKKWGKFKSRIEALNTNNLVDSKSPAVCRNSVENLQLSAPPTFFTHNAAGGRPPTFDHRD